MVLTIFHHIPSYFLHISSIFPSYPFIISSCFIIFPSYSFIFPTKGCNWSTFLMEACDWSKFSVEACYWSKCSIFGRNFFIEDCDWSELKTVTPWGSPPRSVTCVRIRGHDSWNGSQYRKGGRVSRQKLSKEELANTFLDEFSSTTYSGKCWKMDEERRSVGVAIFSTSWCIFSLEFWYLLEFLTRKREKSFSLSDEKITATVSCTTRRAIDVFSVNGEVSFFIRGKFCRTLHYFRTYAYYGAFIHAYDVSSDHVIHLLGYCTYF